MRTRFENLPHSHQGKLVDVTGRRLALVNPSGRDMTLHLGTSGDAETRPENVSMDFYVKFKPEGEVPVGTIATIGRDLPANDNWLPCDGRSLPVASYPALYQAIGTLYGSPGSGQFSLPDLEGRFLRGASQGTGHDPNAGHQTRPAPAIQAASPACRVRHRAAASPLHRVGAVPADQHVPDGRRGPRRSEQASTARSGLTREDGRQRRHPPGQPVPELLHPGQVSPASDILAVQRTHKRRNLVIW